MKPAPFAYHAPATLAEALALLAEHGYDAKLLAGGQSLIPAMNFRMAQPAVLIDLNRVAPLAYLEPDGDGGIRCGAMTRQRAVERSALVAERAPLLRMVMPWIAHVQIRNRGTIGGSLAHADPAAELPAAAVALQARLKMVGPAGERWVEAADFFVGLFTTDLGPDELLAEIAFPPLPARTGCGFAEYARRTGDYAIAGAAALLTLDDAGACVGCRLVFFSVGDAPILSQSAPLPLLGEAPNPERIAEAARFAAQQDIEPTGDIHASAIYRRHLAEVTARRALTAAAAAHH